MGRVEKRFQPRLTIPGRRKVTVLWFSQTARALLSMVATLGFVDCSGYTGHQGSECHFITIGGMVQAKSTMVMLTWRGMDPSMRLVEQM